MIYLDNAATSFPKPVPVIESIRECMKEYCGNPGRSGHLFAMKTAEKIYQARKEVATLLGVKRVERILFTSNTTEAINLALKGMLRSGDHVVTTMMEHNSVLRPLVSLQESGITHSIAACDGDGHLMLSDLENCIRTNTKLIVTTHASNVTGTIQPVEEVIRIARKHGIPVLLDAAQSAGCLPLNIDATGPDLVAMPGHKGLLGPQGTGILYVSPSIKEFRPVREGGTGTSSKELRQPWDYPEGFEAGTPNSPGIIGLGTAASWIRHTGIQGIRSHELELNGMLTRGLSEIRGVRVFGPGKVYRPGTELLKTGITLWNMNGMDCEAVADGLYRNYGIACRAGYHCAPLAHRAIGTYDTGAVRFSVGPFNTRKEIDLVLKAVSQISKEGSVALR